MTCLLDTYHMIWALADTKKLSARVKDAIVNPDNRIIVSSISFWEVSLKSSLGKLSISGFSPADLPGACAETGFEIKSLSPEDASTYHLLKASHHKDPFDRMLIWQAIRNHYTFISADKQIKKYAAEGLKLFGVA
jgi:PIN domain nuclease of toxin-antitoxin system